MVELGCVIAGAVGVFIVAFGIIGLVSCLTGSYGNQRDGL